jgi:hypothetical protein
LYSIDSIIEQMVKMQCILTSRLDCVIMSTYSHQTYNMNRNSFHNPRLSKPPNIKNKHGFFRNRYRWYSVAVIFALLPFLAADTDGFVQTAFTSNVDYSHDIFIARKPVIPDFIVADAIKELPEIKPAENQQEPEPGQSLDESTEQKLSEAGYGTPKPDTPVEQPTQNLKPVDKVIPKPANPQRRSEIIFSRLRIRAPIQWSQLSDIFESNPDGSVNFGKEIQEDLSKGPLSTPIQRLLVDGVVHMASSQPPGNLGNSYIIGHSSNYQTVKSNYNYVFANLKNARNGDEFIIYDIDGRELTFEVFENIIIDAGDSRTAYKAYPDRRVVTLQASVLVNGRPLKRQLIRGELKL